MTCVCFAEQTGYAVCAAMLSADSHADNFLSPVIGKKMKNPCQGLILRELLGKNESMRPAPRSERNRSCFV
jgi:hypothetical protein